MVVSSRLLASAGAGLILLVGLSIAGLWAPFGGGLVALAGVLGLPHVRHDLINRRADIDLADYLLIFVGVIGFLGLGWAVYTFPGGLG